MKIKPRFLIRAILLSSICTAISLTTLIGPMQAYAAPPKKTSGPAAKTARTADPAIAHTTPKELPRPGAPLTLEFEILNSRAAALSSSVILAAKVLLTRDGEFTAISADGGLFNERDNVSYRVTIPTPETTLSYQFVLSGPDGIGIASTRYEIHQPCREALTVPDKLTQSELEAASPEETLVKNVQTSEALQYDIQDLKRALATAQELMEVLQR